MLPRRLSAFGHDQQATVGEFEVLLVLMVSFSTHLEGASSAERQGSDDRVLPESRLVIGVPSHLIPTIPVEVGEDGREEDPGMLLDFLLETLEERSECSLVPCQIRVRVLYGTIPRSEAGLGIFFSEHPNTALLELDFVEQVLERERREVLNQSGHGVYLVFLCYVNILPR